MKKISEKEFELEFEEIKNSDFELIPKHNKTNKGETMKNIKKINYKKIIETIKTLIIYTAIVAGIAFYLGVKHGENNAKIQNEKVAEQVRNLSQK